MEVQLISQVFENLIYKESNVKLLHEKGFVALFESILDRVVSDEMLLNQVTTTVLAIVKILNALKVPISTHSTAKLSSLLLTQHA